MVPFMFSESGNVDNCAILNIDIDAATVVTHPAQGCIVVFIGYWLSHN